MFIYNKRIMYTNIDVYSVIKRLEERIKSLEEEVSLMKQNTIIKSRQTIKCNRMNEIQPEHDYETFMESLIAKYNNIDDTLKMYQDIQCLKTKKQKVCYFQKWIQNMLCNTKDIIPIRFYSNQLYKYSYKDPNDDHEQWIQIPVSQLTNQLRLIIKCIIKDLTKWSELTCCHKYSTEMRDLIFVTITEILTLSYNNDEFEKLVKNALKTK
jgi:hypothetical protein